MKFSGRMPPQVVKESNNTAQSLAFSGSKQDDYEDQLGQDGQVALCMIVLVSMARITDAYQVAPRVRASVGSVNDMVDRQRPRDTAVRATETLLSLAFAEPAGDPALIWEGAIDRL